jgi:hypothetical protein
VRLNLRGMLLCFLVLAAPAIWACTCVESRPCELRSPVVVVGRILLATGDEFTPGKARVRVENVLKGPRLADEVEIDRGTGSSCYQQLDVGKEYVLYLSTTPGNPSNLGTSKCAGNFLVTGNENILTAVKSASVSGPFLFAGTVFATDGLLWREAVPRANVTVEGASVKFETKTDEQGRFEFPRLVPGRYNVSFDREGYIASKAGPSWTTRSSELVATEHGCEVRFFEMTPDGRVSGRVSLSNGDPAKGVEVQAFKELGAGMVLSVPAAVAKTDAEGGYTLRPLPPGDYVLRVKLDDKTFPSRTDLQRAQRFHLEKQQEQRGVDLKAGTPSVPLP